MNFDNTQATLLNVNAGKHFVSAPPGAGKTALLTGRLAQALERYTDDQIVCLTFTVRAALEMQQRAASVLADRNPFVGNFHGFCMELLRQTSHPAFRSTRFKTLLPEEYCRELVSLAVDETESSGVDYTDVPDVLFTAWDQHAVAGANVFKPSWHRVMTNIYAALALVNRDEKEAKALGEQVLQQYIVQALADVRQLTGITLANLDHAAVRLYRVFEAYQAQKRYSNAIDFDDLLVLGYALLMQEPHTKAFIQVDEVQDLNPVQWAILEAITQEDSHVFAVGDELQSIYSFLGADVAQLSANTQEFTQHYLENNYRASPALVDVLNAYREAHWQLPAIQAKQTATSDNATMLLGAGNIYDEIQIASKAIQQILSAPERNIGMLLPTNKLIDMYCRELSKLDVPFFRVSENDLMQQISLQDGFSILRLVNGSAQRVDWWSVIYRLTRATAGNKYTRKDIIGMVNTFARKKLPLADVLIGGTDLLDYPYRDLHQANSEGGVVIFDTETTGLDFMSDKIIQLAAVKVIGGEVVAQFDEYVSIELHSDPELLEAFRYSQTVHHISDEQVAHGDTWPNVLERFLDFVGDCPLLAHNLKFDIEMLKAHGDALQLFPQIAERFNALLQRPAFDTLHLSRLLLPDAPNYKLETLLAHYDLAGVNSHNALDDVKATASLFTLLISKMPAHLAKADALLDQYDAIIKPFRYAWNALQDDFVSQHLHPLDINLSKALDRWFTYAQGMSGWYQEETLMATQMQVQQKLSPWLDKYAFRGVLSHLIEANVYQNAKALSQQKRGIMVAQLGTLKETDLIDPTRDRLIISTVHRAKGLEFETVYLPCCVDNNYPRWQSDKVPREEREAQIAESKRLLYVALSRPKQKLIVTYHQFDGRFDRHLSDFITPCLRHFAYQK